MEKRLPLTLAFPPVVAALTVAKGPANFAIFAVLCAVLGFVCPVQAQTPAATNVLRVELWVPFDDHPALQVQPEEGEEAWMPAVRNLHNIAPVLIAGMVYGWDFSYAPSDKTRRVPEYFEALPLGTIHKDDPRLSYHDSAITGNRVITEAEYERTPQMMQNRAFWRSTASVKVHGVGYGNLLDGTQGLESAVQEAIKNAIHTYAQSVSKNKPKEITGSIILVDENPTVSVRHGQYKAELDFFLHVVTITQYSVF